MSDTATELKAGRELDAMIAERITGLAAVHWYQSVRIRERVSGELPNAFDGDVRWEKCEADSPYNDWIEHGIGQRGMPMLGYLDVGIWGEGEEVRAVPDYSTDIKAAWKVVEKMQKENHALEIESDDTASDYYVEFEARDWDANVTSYGEAREKTLPLAICVAALRAVSAGSTKGTEA